MSRKIVMSSVHHMPWLDKHLVEYNSMMEIQKSNLNKNDTKFSCDICGHQVSQKASLVRPFPPVTGGYSGQDQRGEYPPPMKQASVIWRLGNEWGLDMRDFQLRSNFYCFIRHNCPVYSHSFACLQIVEAFLNENSLKLLPVIPQCNRTRAQSKRAPQLKIPHIQASLIP